MDLSKRERDFLVPIESFTFGYQEITIFFSNLIALSAWASLILINFSSMLTMFAVALLLGGFGSLLLAERALNIDSQDTNYWRMRLVLTMIVIVVHALVLAFLIREFI